MAMGIDRSPPRRTERRRRRTPIQAEGSSWLLSADHSGAVGPDRRRRFTRVRIPGATSPWILTHDPLGLGSARRWSACGGRRIALSGTDNGLRQGPCAGVVESSRPTCDLAAVIRTSTVAHTRRPCPHPPRRGGSATCGHDSIVVRTRSHFISRAPARLKCFEEGELRHTECAGYFVGGYRQEGGAESSARCQKTATFLALYEVKSKSRKSLAALAIAAGILAEKGGLAQSRGSGSGKSGLPEASEGARWAHVW